MSPFDTIKTAAEEEEKYLSYFCKAHRNADSFRYLKKKK
jgi:hypothetical protein